jgi:hypothetical protein
VGGVSEGYGKIVTGHGWLEIAIVIDIHSTLLCTARLGMCLTPSSPFSHQTRPEILFH